MARTKLVEVSIPAGRAVGEVDQITVDFAPQGAVLMWNGRGEATDAQGRATHHRGASVWTPTAQRCLSTTSEDARASGQLYQDLRSGAQVIKILDHTGAVLGESTAGAATDNGDGTWSIPLTCSTLYAAALDVAVWVIGDVTGCDVVGGSTQDSPKLLSTPSGAAEALILVASVARFGIGTSGNDMFSLGLAAKNSGQAFASGTAKGGANPSVAHASASLSEILAVWNGAATNTPYRGSVSAWNADSIELTLSATSAAEINYFGLAIVGCEAVVTTVPLPATTQSSSPVSGLAFEPAGGLVIAPRLWDTGGGVHANDQTCYGAFDHDLAQAALSTVDLHGVSPTVVATSLRHSDCFVRQTESGGAGGAPVNAAALKAQSIQADGVTFLTTMPGDGAAAPAVLLIGPALSATPPTAPTGVSATTNVPAPVVSWTPGTGQTSEYVHRVATGAAAPTDATTRVSPALAGNVASWTDNTKPASAVYDYYVEGVGGGGSTFSAAPATARVNEPPVIAVDFAGGPMSVGDTQGVHATATDPEEGDVTASVVWVSNQESIATVDGSGGTATITKVAEGTAQILATAFDSHGASAQASILVTDPGAGIVLTLEEPMLAVRQRGVAATLPVPCKDPATGAYLTTNPLAPGDVTLSADGAVPVVLADDVNAATWAFRNGRVMVPLSAAEMAGDYLTLQVEDRDASAYISPPVDIELTGYDPAAAPATPADVRAEMDTNSTALAAIQSTQTDLQSALGAVQGRTDLIPDDLVAPDNASIAAIKAKTDVLVVAGGAVAASLSGAERDAVAAALMDLESAIDSFTPRQVLALLAARSLGKGENLDSATPSFLAIDGSKPRVTGDVSDPATRNVTLDAS